MKLSLTVAVFACVAVVSAIPLQKRQDPAAPQDLSALDAQLQGLGQQPDLLAGQPAQPPVDPAAQPPVDPAAQPPVDPAAQPPVDPAALPPAAPAALPPADPNAQLAQAQPVNDVNILNFALSLEHLEAAFYAQGLDKFSEADFRRENIPNPTQTFQNFYHILQHEAQHVKTLQTVITSLGGTPVPPCEYQFPFQTVRQFMGIANSLEKVGVSAYDGALAIMQSGDLQTAAATIATVEARHASFLQTANGGDPFPENFDVPLDGREIITLASPFIKSCPFDLGFVPFGQLQIKKQIQLPESDVECTFQPAAAGAPLFCNWLFSDQSIVSPLNGNLCRIPLGARGDVYLAITNDQTPLSLKKTDTIVAGPAIVTVDTAHTDSCKKLFSGKMMKEGKLNQPMDHGTVPMNEPSKDFGMIPPVTWEQTPTPTPAGTPPGQENAIVDPTPVATTPPSPENAVVPPPVVPTPVEVKDPGIQSLFDEIQACSTPTPAIPAPTPTTTPELALGVPPEPTGAVPPAYGATPPAYGATPPPPPPENVGGLPPPAPENVGGLPPPAPENVGGLTPPAPETAMTPPPPMMQEPPAYGAQVPPAPELAPPNPELAVTVPPPAPENSMTPPPPMMQEPPAYGAGVPPAPELATPTPELTTGVPPAPEQTPPVYGGEPLPPTDLTGAPTYGSDPNAPVDPNAPPADPNAPTGQPVIEGMDNLTTEAPPSDQAEFPVLVL